MAGLEKKYREPVRLEAADVSTQGGCRVLERFSAGERSEPIGQDETPLIRSSGRKKKSNSV